MATYPNLPRFSRTAGTPLGMLMGILNQANQGYEDARNANQERYNTILDRDLATRNRLLDYLKTYGDSAISDTNRDWNNNLQNSLASLSGAGMLGSTVRSSVEARNQRERQDALRRVKDDLLRNTLATDERASNRLSDFQERVTDTYPNNSNTNAMAAKILQLMAENGELLGNNRVLTGGTTAPGAVRGTMQPAYARPNLQQLRQSDSATQAELDRRRAMAGLFSAMHPALGTAQDPINQQLYASILSGVGQWNPSTRISTQDALAASAAGTPFGMVSYGGGPGYAAPQASAPSAAVAGNPFGNYAYGPAYIARRGAEQSYRNAYRRIAPQIRMNPDDAEATATAAQNILRSIYH